MARSAVVFALNSDILLLRHGKMASALVAVPLHTQLQCVRSIDMARGLECVSPMIQAENLSVLVALKVD